MTTDSFANRVDAGRQLARHLISYADRSDVLVLGLPRGGVPVAAEVAQQLAAPLDVFLVRKLGVPGHPELAMGAIAEGGIQVLDERLIRDLGIPRALVEQVAMRERLELDRRDRQYRGARRRPNVSGRTVIVVDDGLATGATMEAALVALRQLGPAAIVAAAPVGASQTCQRLRNYADRVVCAVTPDDFGAVGLWYVDFSETSDDEVRRLIGAVESAPRHHSPPAFVPLDPVALVRRRALPWTEAPRDRDRLIDALATARVVLLGEATHGTHEFYRERAAITRRLIVEKGFTAVAVEADWPDAYRVNRYVRGTGGDRDATEALADFRRFPSWMWRNADVLDFVGWLRSHNEPLPVEQRAGFYGLDLYSLHASMRAVIAFLDKVDPPAGQRARARYACFDRFGDEMQSYAHATGLGIEATCEREVVTQLVELRRRAAEYAQRDGRLAQDEYFVAEQNARVVRDAEAYYRTMFGGRVASWNLRDHHMTDTLSNLVTFLGQPDRPARVVVWAHNSHLGDARATEMGEHGELNVGQLARERFGAGVVSVGFTTFTGTVTAATAWDGPAHRRHVRPALAASYEHLFHESRVGNFLLPLRTDLDLASALAAPRLERAIGVLYLPETERRSHYFHARLADQFDYVVHLDETRAVEPMERTSTWDAGELAETFPTGL
ncbi:MAG TPA: erythromycin esterase family protein [Vicinamibacterales bacterium]|nr:erythromycin esterase family protein [Vicinamibacterales bacterium]